MQNLTIIKVDPSAKELAVLIRAALKIAFRGVKFSVRKSDWNTVSVSYTDGPTRKSVEAVIARFGRSGGVDNSDCAVFLDGDIVMTANGPVLYAYRGFTFVYRTETEKYNPGQNMENMDAVWYR